MTVGVEEQENPPSGLSGEAALSRLAKIAEEFGAEQIATTARSIAERSAQGRFYVACIGQFKRGKSTLLNALIGSAVLPAGVIPVTAVPTVIRYGPRLAARVSLQHEGWTDIPPELVEEYVSEEKNPENAKGVTGVEIFFPAALLSSGMCLVDTPGIGSVFAGNTAATQAFIPHIDAAIAVIGSDPPLSGDELTLIEAIAKEVPDLVIVLNKADRASEQDLSAALQFAQQVLERHLQRNFPVIYAVSALKQLEQKGPEGDWNKFRQALEDLVQDSGRLLVRNATGRALRRASSQLLSIIREDRDALQRPVEESTQRIIKLRETVIESELRVRDLGVLLGAEQQRLSALLGERRKVFLKQVQAQAHAELANKIRASIASQFGPAYRRNVNRLAQEIAVNLLKPWLEEESTFAEAQFCSTAKRFVDLANEFLRRLGESEIPGLEALPEELGTDQGLTAMSQFYFNVIERVAAPASPLLFLSDVVARGLGMRRGMDRGAKEFLDELLEFNTARVQSDVDERLRQSRKHLESEITGLIHEASRVAERALARARIAQSEGAHGIQAALARLDSAQQFVEKAQVLEIAERQHSQAWN
jgi:GTP-binding protein EngB required for normal cell division